MSIKKDISDLREFLERVLNNHGLPLYALALSVKMREPDEKISLTWYHASELSSIPNNIPSIQKDIGDIINQVVNYVEVDCFPISAFDLTLYLPSEYFNYFAMDHPDKINNDIIQKTMEVRKIKCTLQILRKYDPKDIPPVLT
jgi:hypothetical protein